MHHIVLLACSVHEWIPLLLIADDPKIELEVRHVVHRGKLNITWKDIFETDLRSLHLKIEDVVVCSK